MVPCFPRNGTIHSTKGMNHVQCTQGLFGCIWICCQCRARPQVSFHQVGHMPKSDVNQISRSGPLFPTEWDHPQHQRHESCPTHPGIPWMHLGLSEVPCKAPSQFSPSGPHAQFWYVFLGLFSSMLSWDRYSVSYLAYLITNSLVDAGFRAWWGEAVVWSTVPFSEGGMFDSDYQLFFFFMFWFRHQTLLLH
jgi:hypothetical protein